MIPVDQEDFSLQRGDCLSAAVASILELPLADVPKWVADDYDNDAGDDSYWHWWVRFLAWTKEQGIHFAECADWSEDIDRAHREPLKPGEFYLVFGPTVRGTHHAVVYCNGALAHDPHPSRVGVLKIDQQYHYRRPFVPASVVAG